MSDVRIIVGDTRTVLPSIPDDTFHCVVTSPPYWNLRDYEHPDALGSEETLAEYVEAVASVFDEVRRVLRPDGSMWLNLGDAWANDSKWGGTGWASLNPGDRPQGRRRSGLKPKDQMFLPHRIAIAMQERKWFFRDTAIWHKSNPLVGSARDRPTHAFEYVFLATKEPRYWYDDVPTMEAAKEGVNPRTPSSWANSPNFHGRDPRYKDRSNGAERRSVKTRKRGVPPGDNRYQSNHLSLDDYPRGLRRMRNVWTIPTAQFKGPHFATFPLELVRRGIVSSTSERGVCPACGAQWNRISERVYEEEGRTTNGPRSEDRREESPGFDVRRIIGRVVTHGWEPSCDCDAGEPVPATVFDPFGGVGTTALMASRLQRDSTIIELNPKYADLAVGRLEADGTLLTRIERTVA